MQAKVIKLIFVGLMLSGNFAIAADKHTVPVDKIDSHRSRVVTESIKTKEASKDQATQAMSTAEEDDHQKIKALASENLKLQETVKILEGAVEDYKKLVEARKQRIEELEKSVAELKKQAPAQKK